MIAVDMQNVSKKFKTYKANNRWLRRQIIDFLHRKPKYHNHWTLLSEINLRIESGEVVSILGKNGSGKTTLLKIIAGILQPTSGNVVRNGSIGAILDLGTGFHDDLTGYENVLINGAILGLSERYLRAIMPEIEYFAELEKFMDTPLRYYSSGMRARLGFSVAMSLRPDILLIDEVLAVGDEGFRNKCYSKFEELIQQKKTIIIVSHDTESIRRFCSRGIWLHQGKVVADGSIDGVCEEYLDYYSLKKQSEIQGVIR